MKQLDQLQIEPLIRMGYLVLLTACPECRLQTIYGAARCQHCRTQLPPKPPAGEVFIAVRGEHATPFVECPNCRKLLEFKAELCPECREEIDPDYAVRNAVARVLAAQASSSADAIESSKLVAAITAVVSAMMFAIDRSEFDAPVVSYLTLFPSAAYLILAFGWLRKYGRLPLHDEEFLRAKRKVWPAGLVWLGLLTAQSLFILLWRSGVL